MVLVFRILVMFAVAALGGAVFLPFAHPVPVHVNLSEPAPSFLWLGPALLVVAVAVLVAAFALLLFRRWGQWLGAFAFLAGITAYSSVFAIGLGTILATTAQALMALSAVSWLACLLLSYHPTVAARFRHAH